MTDKDAIVLLVLWCNNSLIVADFRPNFKFCTTYCGSTFESQTLYGNRVNLRSDFVSVQNWCFSGHAFKDGIKSRFTAKSAIIPNRFNGEFVLRVGEHFLDSFHPVVIDKLKKIHAD